MSLKNILNNPAVKNFAQKGELPEVPTVVEFDMESTVKVAIVLVVTAAAIMIVWKILKEVK